MKSAPVTAGIRSAWAIYGLIAVFLLLLWAPMFDTVFDMDKSRAAGENRLPAAPPDWNDLKSGHVQKYIGASETYFNDHFGFRNKLVRWFQNWKLGFFHDRTVYNIITGPNQWLFIGELQMVEHYIGSARFTPEELQAWQQLLERRRDWLAARGIGFLFVVPPDKQSIYPEELPDWLRNAAPAGRETKLDQFLAHMKARSTVQILDLREPLLAAKTVAPTYLQNDTHWNLFGGFIASQELVRALSKQVPGLPPLRSEDFTWTNTPFTSGDLARMIGSDAAEKNYYKFTQKNHVLPPVFTKANSGAAKGDPSKASFIAENPALTNGTAMVFHDSFGNAWRQFLGYSLKRVEFVFARDNRGFNPKLILENRPDVVVNEILERYFNTQDPVALLASDKLP
jgi:hypothetical protein